MLLDEIAMFSRVAAAGSLAAAARELGVPKSTLSRAISRLEDKTRIQLFHRSARAIQLTEAGRRFHEQVAPHLMGLDEATRALDREDGQLDGTLRLTAPSATGELLGELLTRFGARYPRLRIELELTQRQVDLVREGFDVALRAVPKLDDCALVARKLYMGEVRLYAAPSYLVRSGTPREPAELAQHELVSYQPALRGSMEPAALHGAFVAARFAVNEFGFLRSMLRAGAGIGLLPEFHAAEDLVQGRLVEVLPEWSHPLGTMYVVYPLARYVPTRVIAFRDFVSEALQRRGRV